MCKRWWIGTHLQQSLQHQKQLILFLLLPNRPATMQNYSYYFIPVFPYAPPFIPTLNPQAVPVSLTFTAPTVAPLPQHHPAFHHSQIINPSPAEDYQPLPNIEPRLLSTQSSPRPLQSVEPSRSNVNQSFVIDHNVYKYPKKNAQSNLINQIFSYISIPSKSRCAVLGLFSSDEEKARLFYEIMRSVKRQNKKYINRHYLKELLLMEKSHIIHGILQKIKIEIDISISELRTILRKLVTNFLREKCVLTILTSSKLDRYAIKEHLMRRREVLQYLCYHIRVGVGSP